MGLEPRSLLFLLSPICESTNTSSKIVCRMTCSTVGLPVWKHGFSQNLCSKLEWDSCAGLCPRLCHRLRRNLHEGTERVWEEVLRRWGGGCCSPISPGRISKPPSRERGSPERGALWGPNWKVRKSHLKQQQRLWEHFPSLKSYTSPMKVYSDIRGLIVPLSR